jgi:uncharacterized protein (TIGR03086 family)
MRTSDLRAHDAFMTDASISELIAIGRDREAVVAATQGEPMDGVQQLDEIMPLLEAVVDGIRPDQLDDPTPCANFTVSGVLEHMIGGVTVFAPAFRGESEPAATAPTGTLTEQWRHAMADLLDAVHTPGAQERTIAAPIGEVPGAVFTRFVAFDGLVHGWDLATATGQPYNPRQTVVSEVDAFARQALAPEMRDGDTFAAETDAPPDASQLERLVAFSGRSLPN